MRTGRPGHRCALLLGTGLILQLQDGVVILQRLQPHVSEHCACHLKMCANNEAVDVV